jgi:hypothetical protein
MKKIALFVEGQTEQIFSAKLIREFIGKHGYTIEKYKFIGGHKIERKPLKLTTKSTDSENEFYFIIYDCGGDGKVQSDIRERIDSLQEEAFNLIIGIRDVYPETDLEKLRKYLYFRISSHASVAVKIVLAINEIESWFIAEENHYAKISSELSFETVNKISGIDVRSDSTESIPHPSSILKQIYIEGGTTYNKSEKKVHRTVDALDYDNLYLAVRKRNASLNEFLTCLDGLIPLNVDRVLTA